jgi:hypothetical protein
VVIHNINPINSNSGSCIPLVRKRHRSWQKGRSGHCPTVLVTSQPPKAAHHQPPHDANRSSPISESTEYSPGAAKEDDYYYNIANDSENGASHASRHATTIT